MTNPYLTRGRIWRLHHGDREVARLTVRGVDMPWTEGEAETLPGFERFRPLFAEQARALDEEDWAQFDSCVTRISNALTLTFPDGAPVAEFLLHFHDDGTATWRWDDEPHDA